MKLTHILAVLTLGGSVFAETSNTHNKAILATFVTVTTTEYLNGTPTGTLTENTPSGLAPSISRGESTYVTTLYSNGQPYTTVSQTILPQVVVAQTVYQTVTVDLATVSGYGDRTASSGADESGSATLSGSGSVTALSASSGESGTSSGLVESSSHFNSSSSVHSTSSLSSGVLSNGTTSTTTTPGGRFQNLTTITSGSLSTTVTNPAESGSSSAAISSANSTSTIPESNPDNAGLIAAKFSPCLILIGMAMAMI